MYYLYSPRKADVGLVHLSTDGEIEDCSTTKFVLNRERGGKVGSPKAEDLLAARLAHRDFRLCRICFKIGPKYGRS